MTRRRLPRRARGAAILLALLIMTLVATLAAGMVWLQWRGIEVESADRARGQGEWLLNSALDWGKLILRSSVRNNHLDDDLTQPWATPLAETKLSSFLSADGSRAADADGPEVYLSGQITDAQSKYNLYNLVVPPIAGQAGNGEAARFDRLCASVGAAADACARVAAGFAASWAAVQAGTGGGAASSASAPQAAADPQAVLMPRDVDDLAWYGIDAQTARQLGPYVELIPPAASASVGLIPINVNTASAQVLAIASSALNLGLAQALVQRRQQKPFENTKDVLTFLNLPASTDLGSLSVTSQYFEIYGQLRYEQHVLRERSLVERPDNGNMRVLRRVRLPPDAP
jgi:general secretion pathway protein K